MHTPDLDALLQPFADPLPCGPSIRSDSAFLEIRLDREEDDPSLPMGIWERPLKRANWPAIAERCAELLRTRSKDLQLAAWLTEAWTRTEQIAGLARGLQLMQELLVRYWEPVHPVIEDGDTDARLAPFEWLNESLPRTINLHVPVAELEGRKPPVVNVVDWDRMTATELGLAQAEAAGDAADAEAADAQTLTRAMVIAYSHGQGQALAKQLSADVSEALASLTRLDAQLRERLGDHDAPSFAQLNKTLLHLQRIVQQLQAPEVPPVNAHANPNAEALPMSTDAVTPVDASANTAEALPPAAMPVSALGGPVLQWASREDAYRTLEAVADYLARVEPHSPTPYLVRRAANWGRMPLPELMAEIVREEGDLNRLVTLLGLQRE